MDSRKASSATRRTAMHDQPHIHISAGGPLSVPPPWSPWCSLFGRVHASFPVAFTTPSVSEPAYHQPAPCRLAILPVDIDPYEELAWFTTITRQKITMGADISQAARGW